MFFCVAEGQRTPDRTRGLHQESPRRRLGTVKPALFSGYRRRGAEFRGASLHDSFSDIDGFGGSGEHLAFFLIVTLWTVVAVSEVLAVLVMTATILTEMIADEFNFLRPEIKNYKAEADADLIPIPGQLELHGRCRRCVLLSTCFCALFVADLIAEMEELELPYRHRGRYNFRKIRIATISVRMVPPLKLNPPPPTPTS